MRGVFADLRVCRKETEVRVQMRRHRVVVACREVDVTPHQVALAANDQSYFRVHLQAHQPVDHVHAFALQRTRPLDVALFVEAGFQFHHHRDLLAFFVRFEQGLNHRRVAAHAIQRHLDGQHVRVVRGGVQKIHHRLKAVVRVMHQNIAATNGRENVLALLYLRQG